MLISIIIPAYNAEKTIERCLESVRLQKDIEKIKEVLIVDDGSTMMSVVLIYLLTKTIIEKNAQSISMTKILGYTNHEVSSIYIVSTSIIVSLFILITVPLDYAILKPIFEAMMKEEMAGWMPLNVSHITFLKTIVIGFISYFIVMLIEYKKIKKIPMQDALKNVE